ncbi:HAD family hydrolase [Sphingobacterium olei]|uniref:phosphoglycolate phosphatase n=1 Tax=Sphingobacterium olei TaxID=2571155 RepID=A0A4U0P3S3_9SPHI|nr:HAD family hydrolase [Sphingobacterium olei]TJZ62021.1 HAD family hydrolase [Sphingobacterium olei]
MKLIIFDLDGTLINTLDDLAASCNHTLKAHDFPTHPTSDYKMFVGNGIRTLVERALPIASRNDETIDRLKVEFTRYYNLHAKDMTQPYDDIVPLLHALKNHGFKISVASNKYHEAVVHLVDHYFSTIQFDLVLGHRDNHPAKPDPDIVFDTLRVLNVGKEDCYYIGDSSVDMITAKCAGVTAVGATWGFRSEVELRENGADHIIHHPLDLLNMI